MLLESFKEHLEIMQDFAKFRLGVIDPVRLGGDLCSSFIVGIRVALCQNQKPVYLIHVGALTPRETDVTFEATELLKADQESKTLLLGDFLKRQFKTMQSHFLGAFNWHTFFLRGYTVEYMMPRQEFLERLVVDMLMAQRKRDQNLKKLSFPILEEACCLLIHDAIVSGYGIELETIGQFKPDLTFEADEEILSKTLRDIHQNKTASPPSDLRISKFIVGPEVDESYDKSNLPKTDSEAFWLDVWQDDGGG